MRWMIYQLELVRHKMPCSIDSIVPNISRTVHVCQWPAMCMLHFTSSSVAGSHTPDCTVPLGCSVQLAICRLQVLHCCATAAFCTFCTHIVCLLYAFYTYCTDSGLVPITRWSNGLAH